VQIRHNKTVYQKVGLNIRKIRKEKGYSLSDIAALCDMEKTNLSRIELGKTNTTVRNLHKIAQALEVSMVMLFDGL
jgi:transcriptional regulator with XRE-family HTH domain